MFTNPFSDLLEYTSPALASLKTVLLISQPTLDENQVIERHFTRSQSYSSTSECHCNSVGPIEYVWLNLQRNSSHRDCGSSSLPPYFLFLVFGKMVFRGQLVEVYLALYTKQLRK